MKHCPTCKRNWASGRICPYCDCELVAGSSPAPCSPAHVRFELRTEQGNVATIKGDPNMPEATRKALAAMIDAAVTAANAGKLKAPENDNQAQRPPGKRWLSAKKGNE